MLDAVLQRARELGGLAAVTTREVTGSHER